MENTGNMWLDNNTMEFSYVLTSCICLICIVPDRWLNDWDTTDKEPVDYYRLFVTDGLLQNVLDETNSYGEQYVESHQDHLDAHPRARPHDFVKQRFTMSELLRLLVLIITMGIVYGGPFAPIGHLE